MPASFLTILNEDGSTISTYPKINIGPFLGAIATAITDILSELGSQTIEHISTDKFNIYFYKTTKRLLILLATKKSMQEDRRDLINWFLYNLSIKVDERVDVNYISFVVVDESKGSPLDPLLEEHFTIYNEIEELYNTLNRRYEVIYKIFGEAGKRFLQASIDKLNLPIMVMDRNLHFREVKSDIRTVNNSLKVLLETLEKKIKELA